MHLFKKCVLIFLLALPISVSAGDFLPWLSEGYIEAQLYPYDKKWAYIDSWNARNSPEVLLLTQQSNKLKFFLFENRTRKPLYESPALLIYPAVFDLHNKLTTKIHYIKEEGAYLIAYANNSDPKSDFFKIRDRKSDTFEIHGYLLIPSTAVKEPKETLPTYDLVGFDGMGINRTNTSTLTFRMGDQLMSEPQKEKAQAILTALWSKIYGELPFPQEVAFELEVQESAQLKDLRERYTEVARTQFGTSQFHQHFARLQEFFKQASYKDLDAENQHPHYTVWLTDYAYWLLKTGQVRDALDILNEAAKRDSGNPAKYLTLADAEMQYASQIQSSGNSDYYHFAAQDHYRKFCSLMLQQEKPIRPKTEIRIKSALNTDALTLKSCLPYWRLIDAILKGDLVEAQSLIDQGLSPNLIVYHYNARPPLEFAIAKNNLEMVALLLKNGADPKAVMGKDNGAHGIFYHAYVSMSSRAEKTPKDQALDTRVADLLLQHGADIDAPSYNQSWVLMEAAKIGDTDERVIRYFLKNGANPDLKRISDYHTPLIASLERGALGIARLLLTESRADVNHGSFNSLSTFPTDVFHCKSPLVFYLERFASNKNPVSEDALQILKLMFEKGADPSIGGNSPDKTCAAKNGWPHVEMLARNIPSRELKCLIDQHRPIEMPADKNEALCP